MSEFYDTTNGEEEGGRGAVSAWGKADGCITIRILYKFVCV